jgi:hypothetical protein
VGYGSRDSVPSEDTNCDTKLPDRGTKRQFSSLAQVDEGKEKQQYSRFRRLMIRRRINQLTFNVECCAVKCDPLLMGMFGIRTFTRKMLATGQFPIEKKEAGDSDVLLQGGSSMFPLYSFADGAHVGDKPSAEQMAQWKELAGKKKMKYCSKRLKEDEFCLPTTCGYQFVFQRDAEKLLDVRAFFAMDGLGLAMAIEDGVVQHFLGAMSSHQTCLTLCRRKTDGQLSASNSDDNFLIVGYSIGSTTTEVAETNPCS